jgi:hypothetical protein
VADEKKAYFKDYRFYCQRIKKRAESILGPVRVLVFGSIIRGEAAPGSDIDVLVISENLPDDHDERGKIKSEIKRAAGSLSPFQIHLVTKDEYIRWYQPFVKEFDTI